jgi:hypothetical protein
MFLTGLKTLLLAALSASFGLWLAAPTSAEEPESASAVKPFNGKNLEGWTFKEPKDRSKWTVGVAKLAADNPAALSVDKAVDKPGELVNPEGGGVDIYTLDKFGDCTIRVEVMVPKGSNSGIYVMGEYEVQVLDSFGKDKVGPGDLGGLYGASAPLLNAAKKPGEWQTFVIDFQAPRFEGGKKTVNAKFLKVVLNDEVIHENVEMKGPTPSGVTGQEAETGPLMFQGDHGAVAYRNLVIEPK